MSKTKKLKIIYNPKLLNGVLFRNLKQLERSIKGSSKRGFIPHAYLYEKLCRNFSIKKVELRTILETLKDNDLIEISQVGIKLNFEVVE